MIISRLRTNDFALFPFSLFTNPKLPESQTNSTKDDLALMHAPTHSRNPSNTSYDTNMPNLRNDKTHNRRGPVDQKRANKINSNRFSCGDFSLVLNRQEQLGRQENMLLPGQGKFLNIKTVILVFLLSF